MKSIKVGNSYNQWTWYSIIKNDKYYILTQLPFAGYNTMHTKWEVVHKRCHNFFVTFLIPPSFHTFLVVSQFINRVLFLLWSLKSKKLLTVFSKFSRTTTKTTQVLSTETLLLHNIYQQLTPRLRKLKWYIGYF